MAADSMILRANVMESAANDAEGLRAWLSEPGIEDLWKAAFLARLRSAERDAVRLYAEARKLVGTQLDTAVFIMQTVGAPAGVARASVESIERAKMLSPRQRMEMHARALRENGWTVEPPADWSEAEVVNGNGGPHG